MYITDLRIQNVKLMRDFKLSFGSPDEPRMWTVLIGANGLCKTAILQSIAMAASGQARSNKLADVAAFPDRRVADAVVRIESEFSFGRYGHHRRFYPGEPQITGKSPPRLGSSIVIAPGDLNAQGVSQYLKDGSLRVADSEEESGEFQPVKLTGDDRQELIEMLAAVFSSDAAGYGLIESAGYPRARRPTFERSIDFWSNVVGEIEKGLISGGLSQLLATAASFYPHNPVFSRWLSSDAYSKKLFQPLEVVRAKDLPDWFVVGHGTSRLLPDPLEGQHPKIPSEQRLTTLFGNGEIIGTRFARILTDNEGFTSALSRALIESGLLPAATAIQLSKNGWARTAGDIVKGDLITLRHGSQDVEVPATWLSQGYQSTIAWIADLVGWYYFEHQKSVPLDEMEGLVLIDEIDLHLHPAWQENLIPKLKKVFPRMQFVVTTHSPMVLAGLRPEEIVILQQDEEGNVVPEQSEEIPSLLTGSQIYGRFFGVHRTTAARLGTALRRYSVLSHVDPAKLDDEDHKEIESLKNELEEAGIDPETGLKEEEF